MTRFLTGTCWNQAAVTSLARFLLWVVGLELLWGVYVGTTQSTELISGLIASVLTAIFVEVLRRRGLLEFSPRLRVIRRAWTIVPHVFFDFFLVLWILLRDLARGRRVRGVWVAVEYEEEQGRAGNFLRAMSAALENETPNAIVVDLNNGRALLHSLDTRPSTGREVL
jgi:hypothetical protein